MDNLSHLSMVTILNDKNKERRIQNINYLRTVTICYMNKWDLLMLHIDNEDPNFIIKYPLDSESQYFEDTFIMNPFDILLRTPSKTEVFLNRSDHMIFSFSIIFTFDITETFELSYTFGRRKRCYGINFQVDHGENHRGEQETIHGEMYDHDLFMRKIIVESKTSSKLQKIVSHIQSEDFTPSWENVKHVATLLQDIEENVDIYITQDPSSSMDDFRWKTGRLPEELYMRLG